MLIGVWKSLISIGHIYFYTYTDAEKTNLISRNIKTKISWNSRLRYRDTVVSENRSNHKNNGNVAL
jgi:hypothetical protein